MPFRSEKQRKYLWANEPEIAKKWSKESPVYNISLYNIQFNNLSLDQYELLNRLKGHE